MNVDASMSRCAPASRRLTNPGFGYSASSSNSACVAVHSSRVANADARALCSPAGASWSSSARLRIGSGGAALWKGAKTPHERSFRTQHNAVGALDQHLRVGLRREPFPPRHRAAVGKLHLAVDAPSMARFPAREAFAKLRDVERIAKARHEIDVGVHVQVGKPGQRFP